MMWHQPITLALVAAPQQCDDDKRSAHTSPRDRRKWLAGSRGAPGAGSVPAGQITDAGTVPGRVCPGVHPIIPVTGSPWATESPLPIVIAMTIDREGRSTSLGYPVALDEGCDETMSAPVASALGLIGGLRSSNTTRLLLVEDNRADAALHTAMLRSTALSELFEVVLVGRLSECVAALAEEMPACVLLDMGLPDAQGVEGIARIRIVAPDVPIVVLTGNDDDAVGLEALQCGAQDYLVKGHVDARVLARSIRYAVERMRGDQRMSFLAFHDSLTELANRALFADRLQVALTRSRPRSPASVDATALPATPAVLVIDLDYFKLINDSLGHASGDLVLRAVAQRLQAVVRPSDTVARLGGDEFAVLCEGALADQVALVAQRVVDVLGAPIAFEGVEAFIGASIGVAVAPVGSTDGDGLIRDADIAMYRAKANGRGRFVIFEEEMRAVVQVHHATSNALHRALERKEFRLDYQPAVDLRSGHICGVEALLRWVEPTRGVLAPEAFLASAEESGLIVPIGSWVLGAALEQAGIWARSFPDREPLTMSVNISGRQLVEPTVVDVVARAVAKARVQPGSICLCLEVTETVLLGDLAVMARRLTALKALGVQLAVDDFGTGYSSLNYLQQLPVDILKIDRTFVAGLDHGEKNMAIITTLVEMGKRMHLVVVAEGVETAEQLAVLRNLDCDIAQGFYMARPLSADEITDLLNRDPVW